MWNWIGILSSSLFLFLSPEVHQLKPHVYSTTLGEKVTCGQVDDIRFCMSKMNENSDKLVYFFPGVLHNQYAWLYQRKNFKLRKIWSLENREKAPVVITISVGPFFMSKESDDLLFSEIEKRFNLHPKERIFYGNSLGAYNAFQQALSFQRQNFHAQNFQVQKLILGCPFIPVENPFSDFEVQRDYFLNQDQHGAGFFVRFLTMQLFLRAHFKDKEDWQTSSPLALAYSQDLSNFPDTYIVGGKDDEFHFMYGAKKLAEILEIKNVPHRLDLIDGHHCVVDLNKISEFIKR